MRGPQDIPYSEIDSQNSLAFINTDYVIGTLKKILLLSKAFLNLYLMRQCYPRTIISTTNAIVRDD
jgi:hypothetical protein